VPFARAWQALMQTMGTLAEGRFADAERELDDGESLGRENPNFTLGHFAQGAHLRAETGRARPKVLGFWSDLRPGLPALRLQSALVHAERGQLAEARTTWARLANDGYGVPLDFGRPITLRFAAELTAHLRDRDAAAQLHPALAEYDGQLLVAYTGTTCEGAAARGLGQVETVLGRFDEAAAHFEAALTLEGGARAPALVARTRYWYAWMLAQREARGDAARVEELLAAVVAEAEPLGMRALVEMAARAQGGEWSGTWTARISTDSST
jgi:tetratricopeptide (TPR) repeat protein